MWGKKRMYQPSDRNPWEFCSLQKPDYALSWVTTDPRITLFATQALMRGETLEGTPQCRSRGGLIKLLDRLDVPASFVGGSPSTSSSGLRDYPSEVVEEFGDYLPNKRIFLGMLPMRGSKHVKSVHNLWAEPSITALWHLAAGYPTSYVEEALDESWVSLVDEALQLIYVQPGFWIEYYGVDGRNLVVDFCDLVVSPCRRADRFRRMNENPMAYLRHEWESVIHIREPMSQFFHRFAGTSRRPRRRPLHGLD